MGGASKLYCPIGCETELDGMGRWAPYRVCPACGTGFWPPPERSGYWGVGEQPSAEQESVWAGRDALREATIGSGPGRLLDVGCGFGHFVRWALDRGWDAWGTDFDPWAIERSVLPERVALNLDEFDEPFDVATVWDVLEHVTEPVPFLARIVPLLRPGGRLLVASPSFAAMQLRWPILRHSPRRFNDLIAPEEHALQLTETGLRLAMERAGLASVEFLRPPLATHPNPVLNAAVRLMPSLRKGLFGVATGPRRRAWIASAAPACHRGQDHERVGVSHGRLETLQDTDVLVVEVDVHVAVELAVRGEELRLGIGMGLGHGIEDIADRRSVGRELLLSAHGGTQNRRDANCGHAQNPSGLQRRTPRSPGRHPSHHRRWRRGHASRSGTRGRAGFVPR